VCSSDLHETIASAGERLIDLICTIASGKMTKGETLNVYEGPEVYTREPAL
jgi:altronate dehydratase